MNKYDELCQSISNIVSDYRVGQVNLNPDRVHNWINQFPAPVRIPLMSELNTILGRSYISEAKLDSFLEYLAKNEKLATNKPFDYWKNVSFLNNQTAGKSQRVMLSKFDAILKEKYNLSISTGISAINEYIYLEDGICSGVRVITDIKKWIDSDAPEKAKLNLVFAYIHGSGYKYSKDVLETHAAKHGKQITFAYWRLLRIDTIGVLWPSAIPVDDAVQKYTQMLIDCGHAPTLRNYPHPDSKGFFSSEAGRFLIEQEFLKYGVHIRERCKYLNDYQRPLGNKLHPSYGFGALVVTYRNCPNNCPLALWVGDPWYPLFPRETN